MKNKFEIDTNESEIFKKPKDSLFSKPDDEKVSRRVTIAFTEKEYETLKNNCRNSTFATISGYIRYTMLEGFKK